LLHTLLRIETLDDLQGHPSAGPSWEGFVIEQIIALIPANWSAYFYRTGAGAEIDLLLLDNKNRRVAIEVKYSMSPKASKGFWSAYTDLTCKRGYLVYPGEEYYPLGHNVMALPAHEISRIIG
jgi:uncharacterized protein